VAIAIPDDIVSNRIVAVIAAHDGITIKPSELQQHCGSRIPKYMIPELIEFRDSLPKTSTGKNRPGATHAGKYSRGQPARIGSSFAVTDFRFHKKTNDPGGIARNVHRKPNTRTQAPVLKDQIREFIMENLAHAKGITSFSDDESLMESGVIDSLGIFRLVSFLEEELRVRVSDEEINAETLKSVNSIEQLVLSKKKIATRPGRLARTGGSPSLRRCNKEAIRLPHASHAGRLYPAWPWAC